MCNFDLVTDDLSGPTTNHSINFLFLGLCFFFFGMGVEENRGVLGIQLN